MDEIQENHFKLTMPFYEFLGLWPTQSDLRRRVGLFFFIMLNMSVIIPEVFIFYNGRSYR